MMGGWPEGRNPLPAEILRDPPAVGIADGPVFLQAIQGGRQHQNVHLLAHVMENLLRALVQAHHEERPAVHPQGRIKPSQLIGDAGQPEGAEFVLEIVPALKERCAAQSHHGVGDDAARESHGFIVPPAGGHRTAGGEEFDITFITPYSWVSNLRQPPIASSGSASTLGHACSRQIRPTAAKLYR